MRLKMEWEGLPTRCKLRVYDAHKPVVKSSLQNNEIRLLKYCSNYAPIPPAFHLTPPPPLFKKVLFYISTHINKINKSILYV